MVHAQNYETVSTFVEVMQKKLWPLFSGHGVQGGPKKLHTVFMAITSLCLLSIIFHNFWHTYTTGNLKVDGA